jgi:histone acetyltransferase (RNA polymerase elongator complex component)
MSHANVAIFVPHLGCPHNCSFCNQRTISGAQRAPTPDEVTAISREALGRMGREAAQAQIAFFGGSFTAIEPRLMESLLAAAAPFVGPGRFAGIRLSTRPDAIDNEKLAILRRYGVTAIELGAQSMDDRVLALNGRGHTANDVVKASGLIKAGGFELGLQMMTGLYGDTPEGSRATAAKLADLGPATVRIYPTIVLRGTQLERLCLGGEYIPQSLGEAVELCSGLLEFFSRRGIRVIRLGLHASEGIAKEYVAGPWHPAFRELCESANYLKTARRALADALAKCPEKPREAFLFVLPSELSKLAGQHRANRLALEREFGLETGIFPDGALSPGEVRVGFRQPQR